MGKNRQSLVVSERGQLAQAILHFHVERILHQRTAIAQSELQCNECRVYEGHILYFFLGGGTLVLRIAAMTLAGNSAILQTRIYP